MTLDEAIAIALRDNRDILLKTQDVEKAKAELAEANADLLPTLDFTGSWTNTHSYYSRDLRQTTTQTTLKQYLYKGGKTINTIRQNKDEIEVSLALLDKQKLETLLNVQKTFYTLLLAQEYSNLNQEILQNAQGHLAFIQARYKSGQSSQSDILKIEESLENAQEAYIASLNQVESAEELLKNLLYLEKETKIKPVADFKSEPKEVAYDEAFLKAMSTRPEIKQYVAQALADKKAIEIAKSDNRPSIYASWDYYSRSHISATTTRSWNDYNIIGLTFSWPLFDGWLTKAKVEQAIIDLKETQLNKEKAIKDIALELREAYLSLKDALAKIKVSKSEISLYKDNLEVTKTKYQAGIVSALDLEDSILKYNIANFNQKQAAYDYIIAKATFEKATGGI